MLPLCGENKDYQYPRKMKLSKWNWSFFNTEENKAVWSC